MGYTTVNTYSTFNTSPTTINLLRTGGEYLTKSLAKLEKYSIEYRVFFKFSKRDYLVHPYNVLNVEYVLTVV